MCPLSTNFLSLSTHRHTRLELHSGRGSDDAQKLMTSSILALSRHPVVFCSADVVSSGKRFLQSAFMSLRWFTSNVTAVTEVRSASFGQGLHAQKIFANSFLIFSSSEGYRLYSFPFHVHILCVRYDIVLANTAVPPTHVRIVCLPVRGTPCWVLLLCCKDYFSSSSVVSCAFSALCV